MPYEDVIEPPEIMAAFGQEDSASAQATSAALLALGWQLSDPSGWARSVPVSDEDEEYLFSGLGGGRRSRSRISRYVAQGILNELGGDDRPETEVRRSLIQQYREQPSAEFAAALFESCLNHDDALVRVASAASYVEIATEFGFLLDILARGCGGDDLLVREVAAAALGRVAPEHPALDQPWDASTRGPEDLSPLGTSLIVHGTFAKREEWWQPNGKFHTYIRKNVRLNLYSKPDRFSWSGGYSVAARALAAEELVQWVDSRDGDNIDILAHSHGGNVAMLATHLGLSIGTLILLSVPVHWRRYSPRAGRVGRCVSIRVHCDLVILADRGRQRFHDPRIREYVLPIWFKHGATHDPAAWRHERLDQLF